MIEKVVRNDPARCKDVLGGQERLDPAAPLLIFAVNQNESTEEVLLLLVNVEVQQVGVACVVIAFWNLVLAESVFLLLSVIIITHLKLYPNRIANVSYLRTFYLLNRFIFRIKIFAFKAFF